MKILTNIIYNSEILNRLTNSSISGIETFYSHKAATKIYHKSGNIAKKLNLVPHNYQFKQPEVLKTYPVLKSAFLGALKAAEKLFFAEFLFQVFSKLFNINLKDDKTKKYISLKDLFNKLILSNLKMSTEDLGVSINNKIVKNHEKIKKNLQSFNKNFLLASSQDTGILIHNKIVDNYTKFRKNKQLFKETVLNTSNEEVGTKLTSIINTISQSPTLKSYLHFIFLGAFLETQYHILKKSISLLKPILWKNNKQITSSLNIPFDKLKSINLVNQNPQVKELYLYIHKSISKQELDKQVNNTIIDIFKQNSSQ